MTRGTMAAVAAAALFGAAASQAITGVSSARATQGGARAQGQHPVKLVDQCCYDLDGGGKADDGIFTVALQGDVLMTLIYEDPDGNKQFENKDEIKAAALGNLVRELKD